jgi:hypothetical protein
VPDDGLLKISGAPSPDRYQSIYFLRQVAGLQTQRSPFASIDVSRLASKWLGGKPDALLSGLNVEINNSMTLQRRPGLLPYGTVSIEPPTAFYEWQLATTADLNLIVDTSTGGANSTGNVLRYSSTAAGNYINKAVGAKQTNFQNVVNTLYLGNGSDLYKIVGPNLLYQSNTFGTGAGSSFSIQSPWQDVDVFSLTEGQADPLGGTSATQLVWSTTGSSAILEQNVTPNYTPIAMNTFTISLWMKATSTQNVTLEIADQSASVASQSFSLTSTWTKYQVTGVMNPTSNVIKFLLGSPTTVNAMVIYGAQLEVGGPATTTQITTTKPQGVYLWGIQAPTVTPILGFGSIAGSSLPNAPAAWAPNTSYTVGQIVVDSNGNLEIVTQAGTSGSAAPVWASAGSPTTDGSSVIQSNTVFVTGTSASVGYPNAVTATDTLVLCLFVDTPVTSPTISISDTQSNTWSLVTSCNAGNQHAYLYKVGSANAGVTTVTVTATSATGIWYSISEIDDLAGGIDVHATNVGRDTLTASFTTGAVTTTNANDFLITFATFSNNASAGAEAGTPPSGYQSLGTASGLQSRPNNGHFFNGGVFYEYLTTTLAVSPEWSVTAPQGSNALTGITAAFKTSSQPVIWNNLGPVDSVNGTNVSAGLTLANGVQYYYAFGNSYTGHISNVSPISASTGTQTGAIVNVSGVGMKNTPSGPYSDDPQVDTIYVFRNTDSGSYWFQLTSFPNPGNSSSAGTWSLADIAPDTGETVSTTLTLNGSPQTITIALNDNLYAPIGLLNSPPPAGLVNLEYFAGRMWGSVANLLYYNTGSDNASLLGITQNGAPAESWAPANVIPFNAPIVRSVAMGGGLLVFTTTDAWFVTGQNLLTGGFNPSKSFAGHGLASYNAADIDGSTAYLYLADKQCVQINPSSGSVEIGYDIGNLLETTVSPVNAYVVRHVSGSQDNAVFLADGSSSWYRLNPNQQSASYGGEQTPVWSPQANFTSTIGGIGAIASLQTSPGVTQLLVGQTVIGPVLYRDLNTFTDNDVSYTWNAVVGSIVLAEPGKLAEVASITVEMNNLVYVVDSSVVSNSTPCSVAVLVDEIAANGRASFENLANFVNDPPQLNQNSTVLSRRFYLSQGTQSPTCRHLQILLTGQNVATQDQILSLSLQAALVSEQQ